MNGVSLVVERHFDVAPERVFDAWLDPSMAGRFLFATSDGVMAKVEIDAHVGGRFEIVERRPAGEARHYGRYEEIDRPRRLVFLFRATMAGEGGEEGDWTRVTIEIVPDGNGCTLTLSHAMDPQWADYADRTHQGWTMILTNLAATMESENG